jgi:hypothetical protein
MVDGRDSLFAGCIAGVFERRREGFAGVRLNGCRTIGTAAA